MRAFSVPKKSYLYFISVLFLLCYFTWIYGQNNEYEVERLEKYETDEFIAVNPITEGQNPKNTVDSFRVTDKKLLDISETGKTIASNTIIENKTPKKIMDSFKVTDEKVPNISETGKTVAMNPIIEGQTPKNTIDCFRVSDEKLPDISEISPRNGSSIFFHETSCTSHFRGKVTISSRQACAVESAARLNPNRDVYLLYSSPGVFKFNGEESDKFLEALLSYKNVKIMHLDYGKYTKGTPVEGIYSSGKLESSHYAVSHASDVLRFLTLWKYGGIYLDLDMIVIKSLEDLNLNFAAAESDSDVGSAILSFNSDDGHKMAESCLNDLRQNFDGTAWVNNGPAIIKKFCQNLCKEEHAEDMVGKKCEGFTVYPRKKFYPLYYTTWNHLFEENELNNVLIRTNESYAIHMWNKLSAKKLIPVSSPKVPYLYFARKFCPKVIDNCNKYF